MIERVVVADPRLSAPDVIKESLTINLADLVSRAGYFREVIVVPEKITQGYHLRLRFERYNVTRRVHPAYFPAAFATLTLYLWFGGPIFRAEIDRRIYPHDTAKMRIATTIRAVARAPARACIVPPCRSGPHQNLSHNLTTAPP